MILLTVGTQFPFDRLVRAVDDAIDNEVISEYVVAQIGNSLYKPRNFEYVDFLDRRLLEQHIRKAASIIGHAGMGTMSMAWEAAKPLLVMPRREKYGEVVNDHQVIVAKRFEDLGHVLVAYDAQELPERLKELKDFIPRKREAHPELIMNRIANFLTEVASDS